MTGTFVGIVPNLDETIYHAHAALSSTQARQILDSPARFHYAQTHPRAPKAAFDLGSAVHSKVLGTGYAVDALDFDSFRTKAAQEARDTSHAAGRIPMLTKDLLVVDAMAEAVLAHTTAQQLFEEVGTAEASVFATDEEFDIELRARFDYLPAAGPITAVDLKTTGTSASPHDFAKSAASYGYHVQRAHYLDTLRFATGDADTQMAFVVVETDAPHLVAVYTLDPQFAEMGHTAAHEARRLYRECTDTGIWPGYPEDTQRLEAPMWLIRDHEDRYEEEMAIS